MNFYAIAYRRYLEEIPWEINIRRNYNASIVVCRNCHDELKDYPIERHSSTGQRLLSMKPPCGVCGTTILVGDNS